MKKIRTIQGQMTVKEIVKEAMYQHINFFEVGGIDGNIHDILGYDFHNTLEKESIKAFENEIEKQVKRLLKIMEIK